MTDATLHPLQGDVPYAFQRLWHAFPVLCPARALLARIPRGAVANDERSWELDSAIVGGSRRTKPG